MKKVNSYQIFWQRTLVVIFSLVLLMSVGCAKPGSNSTQQPVAAESNNMVMPQIIPEGLSCGKCGMYPAKYPRWQSQIVFNDGSMTPFDGCKCMFNFMSSMGQFDKANSMDDVAAIFVKDFNTGEWLNGTDAFYVVGSKLMGPMGKELIPFKDKAAAMEFHQEQGGNMMGYSEITPEVLKSLMGNMKMQHHESNHMKM